MDCAGSNERLPVGPSVTPVRANSSTEGTNPFCRLPLLTFMDEAKACAAWSPDADIGTGVQGRNHHPIFRGRALPWNRTDSRFCGITYVTAHFTHVTVFSGRVHQCRLIVALYRLTTLCRGGISSPSRNPTSRMMINVTVFNQWPSLATTCTAPEFEPASLSAYWLLRHVARLPNRP